MASGWRPSKVNGRWVMTRCFGRTIEGRQMRRWEKIVYFWLRDDKTVKTKVEVVK